MGVIFGDTPQLSGHIDADVVRGLRHPQHGKPCDTGLKKALRWIGNRTLSLPDAIDEATDIFDPEDVKWAKIALGLHCTGYGTGYGYGFGYGYGYGYGDGYTDGYGYGDGYGHGDGYGYGDGYG